MTIFIHADKRAMGFPIVQQLGFTMNAFRLVGTSPKQPRRHEVLSTQCKRKAVHTQLAMSGQCFGNLKKTFFFFSFNF